MFPKIGVPPNSSILIGFSIINHPIWGTSIFGNIHILLSLSSNKVEFIAAFQCFSHLPSETTKSCFMSSYKPPLPLKGLDILKDSGSSYFIHNTSWFNNEQTCNGKLFGISDFCFQKHVSERIGKSCLPMKLSRVCLYLAKKFYHPTFLEARLNGVDIYVHIYIYFNYHQAKDSRSWDFGRVYLSLHVRNTYPKSSYLCVYIYA